MTTSRTQQTRPSVPAAGRPTLCLDEIESWIHDVSPVVRALRQRGGASSVGQQQWMADQHELASVALALVEHEAFEAEATGQRCDALHWLHTRVSAVLAASQAVPDRSAAA